MSVSLASQLIVTENSEILRNSVVSFDLTNNQIVYTSIFESNYEKPNTVFYDGIISPPICSLLSRSKSVCQSENFNYQIFTHSSNVFIDSNHPLILDFGTENTDEVIACLRKSFFQFSELDILEIIVAITSRPAACYGNSDNSTRLLWSGVDLVHKKITDKLKISVIQL